MTATVSQKYGTLLTAAGKAAVARAVATNTLVDITHIAFGDGGGEEYYPAENQPGLKNQVYQILANNVYVDADNPNWIVVEGVIPATDGGWWIREAAVTTEDGTVLAIGSYPSSYKPTLAEGSALSNYFRFILEVTNADIVNLKIDPSLVFATREYVDNSIHNHSRQTNVHGGTYLKKPNTLMLRNEDGRCQVEGPFEPEDATPKQWVEDYIADYVSGGVMDYLPTPGTGALRNEAGCTQVEDPILDKDAANKRWVLDEVSRGSVNVAQPVITAPEDGYTYQSLAVSVTVSEIEVKGGGVPSPMSTQIRVLGANEADIVANAVLPYTVTPSVTVPEIVLGDALYVLVRHRDEVEGWSTWSEKKPLKMAAVIQQPASMVVPGRNAQNVGFYNLTLTFSGGKWSDGSAYSGSQTQLVIYNLATGAAVYNSGWVSYRTSLALPTGALSPSTWYWAAVQHKAASAPAKNPEAILEGPKITDANNANATVFATMAAQAPNISRLAHSFPGGMKHGAQANAAIWGATSTDGTAVTYEIRAISYGLSFSKTSGIAENENIVIGASAASQVYTASFQIVAMSASGAEAAPVTVSVTVVQPISVSYLNPGSYSWTCPVTGYYQVIVGGGGGSGRTPTMATVGAPWAGAGGGCAIHNAVYLTAGVTYSITVGDAGETTSFQGIIYATGGVAWNLPGQGYGGQTNTTGGQGGSGGGGCCSGGGGAGHNNGGNGTAASFIGYAEGGASGGGTGGADGSGNVSNHVVIGSLGGAAGGNAGFAGGGGGAAIPNPQIGTGVGFAGGHGCCHINWLSF